MLVVAIPMLALWTGVIVLLFVVATTKKWLVNFPHKGCKVCQQVNDPSSMQRMFLPPVHFHHLSLMDLVAGSALVGIPATVQWIRGTLALKFGRSEIGSYAMTLEKISDFYYERAVVRLLLETSQALHFESLRDSRASWRWEKLKTVLGSNLVCAYCFDISCDCADLRITMDLSTKRIVTCEVNNEFIDFRKVYILLGLQIAFFDHIKVHRYANRAVQCGTSATIESKLTILYNYFGAIGIRGILDLQYSLGLTEYNHALTMPSVFKSVTSTIKMHSQIRQLKPHSRFVHFLTELMPKFQEEWKKQSYPVPENEEKALFIGSVYHSLDHYSAEVALDVRDCVIKDEHYTEVAELMRVIRSQFTEKPKGILLTTRMKDSSEPFFRRVYEHAAKIDLEFADQMDTCIIR